MLFGFCLLYAVDLGIAPVGLELCDEVPGCGCTLSTLRFRFFALSRDLFIKENCKSDSLTYASLGVRMSSFRFRFPASFAFSPVSPLIPRKTKPFR